MNVPIWKPILIALVLAAAAGLLATRGLNKGIDLAGGTVLTYQVNVPENADAAQSIEETIKILADRVDPAGVMNLVWRRVGTTRVEVQMPRADAGVADLRAAYEEAVETVTQPPLTPTQLAEAMDLPAAERAARLSELANGNAGLDADLAALAAARDELAQANAAVAPAQAAYEQTSDALRAARTAYATWELEHAGDDATPDATDPDATDPEAEPDLRPAPDTVLPPEGQALKDAVDEAAAADRAAYDALSAQANRVRAAQGGVDDLTRSVLEPPIDANEITRITTLSNQRRGDRPSLRAEAVARLQEFNPRVADEIAAAFDRFAEYEAVKGPLDDPNDLKALLRGSGFLAFRIGAVSGDSLIDIASFRETLAESGPTGGDTGLWVWRPIRDISSWLDNTDLTPESFAELSDEQVVGFFDGRGLVGQRYGDDIYLLLGNDPTNSITQRDADWEVTSVYRGQAPDGFPTVDFKLNPVGAQRLSQITTPNVQRPMAVLLDGKVLTAPNINEALSSQVQISGDFTPAEVNYLIRTMKAGSLDATLSDNPISEKTYGPSLGEDNLRKGLTASVVALAVVSVFMVLYYFLPGAVAVFALLANMLIILGVMSFIEAVFTLPGIAGMVLTIGMAVDANVLIFERIREEQEAGRDLAAAVREGYGKALSTIIDANLTTMITCIVLGYTASAEIKGFAVTLGIGIAATLFTALFCTKVLLDLYVGFTSKRKLAMLPTVSGAVQRFLSPNVNWLKLSFAFRFVSVLIIVIGMGLLWSRGSDILDIEFRSGTGLSFRLQEDDGQPVMMERAEVEALMDRYADVAARLNDGQSPDAMEPDDAERAGVLQRLTAESQERYDAAQVEAERTGLPPEFDAVADFTLLGSATVVTEGESEGSAANGFGIQTLITDDQALAALIVDAFGDRLKQDPSIGFAGDDAEAIADGAPVHRVSVLREGRATLGDNVEGVPVGAGEDITEFVGGVAVLIDGMSNPLTIEQFEDRLKRIRRQPNFAGRVPDRQRVVGLRPAGSVDGDPVFDAFVYLAEDDRVNYATDLDAFRAADGFANQQWRLVREALNRGSSLESVTKFSSQVSGTMKRQAIVAMSLSLFCVVLYIWLRFGSIRYGLAAIAALVHDVTISLGLIAITGYIIDMPVIGSLLLLEDFKINLAIVAALLTIVGYSLNDTIVVFDRIRENRGRMARATPDIVNDSINQTISRTLLTSGTTLIALFVLYLLGGPGVHGFAFAMLMGVLIGTYSSIAIAAPLLLIGRDKSKDGGKPGTPAAVAATVISEGPGADARIDPSDDGPAPGDLRDDDAV